MDEVDRIKEILKSAKIRLVAFVQGAMTNDTYHKIVKPFTKILTDVTKDVIMGDVDMVKVVTSVIKVIGNNVDNPLIE